MFPRPPFFQDARLNFAENLLYPSHQIAPESHAIIEVTEERYEYVSWAELRVRVRVCAAAMRAVGVKLSDRVAGYQANQANSVVAMLSAASIGAIWTGISPDTGAHAVLERLVQIDPIILFADDAVVYNGKRHLVLDKVGTVVKGLPGLRAVVIFSAVPGSPANIGHLNVAHGRAWLYEDFIHLGDRDAELDFAQLQADHPIYILYSSGTTGSECDSIHTEAYQ